MSQPLVIGMKMISRAKLLTLAGAVVLAGFAQATVFDASILIDRAANNKTLSVKYDGALAALVELRINGVSIASRTVSDSQDSGETTFSLDTAAMENGDNNVEIRLYDKDGKLLGSQKSVVKVDRSGNGPVFLEKPRTGETVQGSVEIKLGFKTDLKNVYVSFFVNDEFKALKNYPPYNYIWDTSRMPNGWHEVQAWVVDETNQTFKTEKMRIFVNNPGGRTVRQSPVDQTPVKSSNSGTAPTTAGSTGVKPTSAGPTKTTAPANVKPVEAGKVSANSSTAGTGQQAGTRPGEIASGQATSQRLMRPSDEKAKPLVAVQTPVAGTQSVAAGTKAITDLAPIAITFGKRIPQEGPFDIMLNGNFVDFRDASPRVENGIPLTPFRHLFEANGGEVKWDHLTKTVDADGNGQKVWLKIGDSSARVNSQTFRLEMAPFIEAGRMMIPLSFMTDALKVKIQYDPNTGHVLILNNAEKK